jgi:predicted nucleic acid-binding protein
VVISKPTKSSVASQQTATGFWDTSAIVPLCCFQSASSNARQLLRAYGNQVVWWATPVEAFSALQRLVREKYISAEQSAQFVARLQRLRVHWNEIQPNDDMRSEAERLLRLHPLRSADALQLSAAFVWTRSRPRGQPFITADGALARAAELEGFSVFRL